MRLIVKAGRTDQEVDSMLTLSPNFITIEFGCKIQLSASLTRKYYRGFEAWSPTEKVCLPFSFRLLGQLLF